MMPIRKAIDYGDVGLSVQASEAHYCSPRIDLKDLDGYSEVEIAVITEKDGLTYPSAIGINGFDDLFEKGDSPVAGYVSWDKVNALKKALTKRQKTKEATTPKAKE